MASSSSANRDQKRRDGKKVEENEEIVRHMSNLPSFLERGKPIQDKALNFGVMDWGRLEQWQYHRQKQGHGLGLVGINKYSLPSSSNSSFLFSTSESSPHSSKGQSSPPHHVTLQSHLNVSPQGISSSCNHSSGKKTRNKPRRSCKTNDLLCVSESNSFDDLGSFQTASSSSSSLKGKMKIQDELVNEPENSYDPKNNIPFENEAIFERNPTTPCQNTQENKELSVSNIKRGTIITASKQRSVSPRHRQTPLRKLLDPFIMSKPTSSGQHFEDSKVKAKVKLDFGSCKEVKVGDSSRNKTKESPKQALFQMAIKNGRPLFTFTVDDKDDILAATVRSLSGKDDANTWIYTFFTIQEVKKKKKKGGWLTKGTAGQGFLPNVTAQMKVTDRSVINSREFVLSSLGQPILDDVQLEEDELAAIVVQFLGNEEGFSMTVILPGGHHSVPSKGEPSPLIERWRSGGACDCGGWDMGCRLRTLANSNHLASTKFDLFFQGDVVSERPFFSLSSLTEGIFSVKYDSSLSLVHAFSICISVMECRKSSEDTQLKTYVAKQVDEDDDDDDDDAPVVKYASLPPLSPVGRV